MRKLTWYFIGVYIINVCISLKQFLTLELHVVVRDLHLLSYCFLGQKTTMTTLPGYQSHTCNARVGLAVTDWHSLQKKKSKYSEWLRELKPGSSVANFGPNG